MQAVTDLAPKASIWFERHGSYLLGDQESRLLEAIDQVGSIKEAAKTAGISYRTAWARLQEMERALGHPVVKSRAGGPGGGATTLTDETRRLLRFYREVSARSVADVEREFQTALQLDR
ncbi:MAG TPA: LysR family transcriptional regulator [Gemmatimonadales bacterium]|nr:LysR family transcriptional regulator [Gemmatimonadales bacterium]